MMLISFSGLDGSGKSEQVRFLKSWLDRNGISNVVLYSRFGRNKLIGKLRDNFKKFCDYVYLKTGKKEQRKLFNMLFSIYIICSIIDIAIFYGIVYRWKSTKSSVILCDRYIWDSYVDFKILCPQSSRWMNLLWGVVDTIAPKAAFSIFLSIPSGIAHDRDVSRNTYIEPMEKVEARERIYEKLDRQKIWNLSIDGKLSRNVIHRYVLKELLGI